MCFKKILIMLSRENESINLILKDFCLKAVVKI